MKRLLLTFTMTIISFNAHAMKRENPLTTTDFQHKKPRTTLITPNNINKIAKMSNGAITVTTPNITMDNTVASMMELNNNIQPRKTVTTPITTTHSP